MKLLKYLWLVPLIVLVYVYGNEAVSVFTGSPEHYALVAGLGLPGSITVALVWLSVVIEAAIIGAVIWKPSALTFSVAALWPWVPRILSAITGTEMEMMEMNMSLIATVAAMCAYMAYGNFHDTPVEESHAAVSANA